MVLLLLALGSAHADDTLQLADDHVAAIAAAHASVSLLYADAQVVTRDQRVLWCIEDRLTAIEMQQDFAQAAMITSEVPVEHTATARAQAERLAQEAHSCIDSPLGTDPQFFLNDVPNGEWMEQPVDFVPDNERTPMAIQAWRLGGSFGIDLQPRLTVGTRLQLGGMGFTELHFHVQPDNSWVGARIFYSRSVYAGPVDLWFGANLEGAQDGLNTEAAVRATMWLFWADLTAGVAMPWTDKPTPVPTTSAHLEYELVWLPPDMTLDLTADARWTADQPLDLRAGVMLDIWWRGNDRPW